MPTHITLLRILVSSPEDMASHRNIVRSAAEELNQSFLSGMDVRLEVISWDTHGAPDLGSDPQAVLNRQLNNWDIYIGLLGNRFGTPTPRADSGTEEEFNAAYQRWSNNNRSCRIMFYFSDAPVPPSQLDPEQLAKVQFFRSKLGRLGSLYWTFRDPAELGLFVRKHLTHTIRNYGKDWGPTAGAGLSVPSRKKPLTDEKQKSIELEDTEEEDDTLLDITADTETSIESFTSSLKRMTAAIEEMGENLEQRKREMEELQNRDRVTARNVKAIARTAADGIRVMASTVDEEIPPFRQSWSEIRKGFFRLLSLTEVTSQGDAQALEKLETVLEVVQGVAAKSIPAVSSLQEALESGSSMSRDIRKSARQARSTLKDLLVEFNYVETQIGEIRRALREKIGAKA